LGRAIEALLLPRVCVGCERVLASGRESMACDTCWHRVAELPRPCCERCGHPRPGGECRWCPLLPPYVRCVRSYCWMPGGVAEQLVHAFKYAGWRALAPELAQRMARVGWPHDVREELVALVPVPLAPARQRERGFNQSELLARALAPALGCAMWGDVVERPRATSSQTRLTPDQRLRNVAGAFKVVAGAPSKLRGAHVMLVDDVVTTAATLNECAATLWNAGARIVSYVTFGRARAAGDAPLSRG
jgi:ComF family protein